MHKRLVNSIAVILAIGVCAPVAAQKKPADKKSPAPKQYVFSRSTTQASSLYLGVTCVPAYVVVGNANRRGIYITGGGSALTGSMGLSPGCVLLTLDDRVVESASTADSLLGAKRAGNLNVSYVQMVSGLPQVVSRSCAFNGVAPQSTIRPGGSLGPQPSIAELEKLMLTLINQDRTKEGAASVSDNSTLSKLARSYAEYMLEKGNFSHVDPDGRDPQARAAQAGIKCGVFENLAFNTRGIPDRDGVVQAEAKMMAEPPDQKNHRYNILLPTHKYVGCGVARNGQKLLMVQEFSDDNP